MLSRRIYYLFKPYIPWSLRMRARGFFAQRKRKRFTATWPIDPAAAKGRNEWPGWPAGKDFSFVITHDVEGPDGLAKCRKLAEYEMSLGFRSSFNFIPEGPYRVTPELRAWLTENGFEVGIHDLNHDGKLFSSRKGFLRKAARINQYAREWGAVGYRSGFMLRNLEWLHDLNIEYDASTFDTDPFEPQPDGATTIFPFWVEPPPGRTTKKGYIELPYTLPQDSSLFLVLREPDPGIWTRKLDWVASQGGMALVNVHPDYLCFDGEKPSQSTFTVEHYGALLRHINKQWGDRVWKALPLEVSRYASRVLPPPRRLEKPAKAKRACIVTYSFYESDTRVLRYGEALAARGDHVDVFSVAQAASVPRKEVVGGCHVHRLQDRLIAEKSKLSFILPHLKFLLKCLWHVTTNQLRKKYDVIHVHNVPDFLVFSAFFAKLGGSTVILDIHDILPELYASKFKARPGSLTVRTLLILERLSANLSDHVILPNHLWLDRYTTRAAAPEKCSVIINFVDDQIFYERPRTRSDDRLVIIFPGSLQWHQGVDIAVRAFILIAGKIPNAEFHIYGEGPALPALKQLAQESPVASRIQFSPFIPLNQISEKMANADLGVVPKRADSFGNQAYSTKIMEFMSLGVPVVVSRTQIDQFYFNDTIVEFFEPGSDEALAAAMIKLLGDQALREGFRTRAKAFARLNTWDVRKADYLELVDCLTT